MDKIDNLAYVGVCNYFKSLSTFGYKSYDDVNKLLTLLFIEYLLDSPFSLYISEDDYRIISKVLYCLFSSTCLIPYPEFYINTSLVQNINLGVLRLAEDYKVRLSENEITRLAEQQ